MLVLRAFYGQSIADDAPIPESVVMSDNTGNDTVLTAVFPHTVNNRDWQAPLPIRRSLRNSHTTLSAASCDGLRVVDTVNVLITNAVRNGENHQYSEQVQPV